MTAAETPTPVRHRVRPFYWSVRRELWENRSIYLAPLGVAGVVLAGCLFAIRHVVPMMHALQQRTADLAAVQGMAPSIVAAKKGALARAEAFIFFPYAAAAGGLMVVAFAVAIFYALACLNAERRDRSVLFWKSLPVSDRTTVLAKAAVPLVVLPVVTWAVIMATQLIVLALDTATLSIGGVDPGLLWSRLHLTDMWTLIPYMLVVLPLWHAPVIGWLMLVSAWSRRGAFLWALVPPAALCLLELIALGSTRVWDFLRHRLVSGFEVGFAAGGATRNDMFGSQHMDPVGLLANPGLWGGLVVFAACLAGCVWLRRRKDPI